MDTDIFYTILYLILSVCIIYPPSEFISAGVTIPNLFSFLLGSEHTQFIHYHIKRSCITLLVYSFIPLGYFLGYLAFVSDNKLYQVWVLGNSYIKQGIFAIAVILPLMAVYQLLNWCRNNYEDHPITKNIKKFLNNNNNDWNTVASDINSEYRSIDKIAIQTNSICRIIATENWVMKITPLTIYLIHQSDASLVVNRCETHYMSQDSRDEVQYINIEVTSRRNNIDPFTIRLNSTDFQDLQDRISRSIDILPDVQFKKTTIEKFLEVFNENIDKNPKYYTQEVSDQCIGCMQRTTYVKLLKQCQNDEGNQNNCTNCYCRPMWCKDCMGRWFASRQKDEERHKWLSLKCTCPMCRAKFCILDVCVVDNESNDVVDEL
ncbi:E3 ubiquitin-protein ligase TM129 [Onthophagus taurus]|uniref:E3 ubiquitin-protein ligase TM129 n=1 Tax=Onthophagus taurus TaxID=166361 RepID=UPI000C20E4EC|nr:E3 ubiquitin-protein ligase TM129 [Onthophagus taurus]